MAVKVVTDSTADLPIAITGELNISVVPIYVRFGNDIYRDSVDISSDEFYAKLEESPLPPTTSQPSPGDFIEVYTGALKEAQQLVSIHISSRLSGTYNSAVLAREMHARREDIAIVDSRFNSAGLGLVTMAAARVARAGGSLSEVVAEANRAIQQVKMFGMFNTMKYLALSGRVSKAVASAADILDVKPLLTFKDGQVARAGFTRSLSKGMERIYQYVAGKPNLMELVIVHSSVPEWAGKLKLSLGKLFPTDKILVMQLGAALGVHGGKGVLIIALRQGT